MFASFLVAPPVVIKSVSAGGARQSNNINSLDHFFKGNETSAQNSWDNITSGGSTYYNAATLTTST